MGISAEKKTYKLKDGRRTVIHAMKGTTAQNNEKQNVMIIDADGNIGSVMAAVQRTGSMVERVQNPPQALDRRRYTHAILPELNIQNEC